MQCDSGGMGNGFLPSPKSISDTLSACMFESIVYIAGIDLHVHIPLGLNLPHLPFHLLALYSTQIDLFSCNLLCLPMKQIDRQTASSVTN